MRGNASPPELASLRRAGCSCQLPAAHPFGSASPARRPPGWCPQCSGAARSPTACRPYVSVCMPREGNNDSRLDIEASLEERVEVWLSRVPVHNSIPSTLAAVPGDAARPDCALSARRKWHATPKTASGGRHERAFSSRPRCPVKLLAWSCDVSLRALLHTAAASQHPGYALVQRHPLCVPARTLPRAHAIPP